jgi:hypothetical protein
MSVKENTLGYLLHLFAANVLEPAAEWTREAAQLTVFGLLNSLLRSFEAASSLHSDLCLFCMEENERVTRLFWRLVACQADRDNVGPTPSSLN